MQITKKLGKYEVKEQLGRGGMGVVYRGYDPYTDRHIAIKTPLSKALKNKEAGEHYRKLFFNEAYTAGTLRHPNILKILDTIIIDEHCHIVMEYIEDADTLKSYCHSENLLSIETVVEIIFKCAKALDYAHRHGVIHRDIKPSNILLTKDKDVKIADFSIAHLITSDKANALPTGSFVGSPRYMSPEQIAGDIITSQTDLFALGIVMYEMLTGKHPFFADSFSRLIHTIVSKEPPRISTYQDDIPEILERIIHHVLQKDPKKRYKTGLDFAADLSLAFDYLMQPKADIKIEEKFNAIQSLDFFNDFPKSEIKEIIHICIWKQFYVGTEIIVEGDIDDAFYIIISGEVDVYKDNTLIGNLKMGDCFGEMNYLTKTKRTATIIAKTRVELMKINETLIEQVSVECRLRFNKIFTRTLAKRLSETTAMYASNHDK